MKLSRLFLHAIGGAGVLTIATIFLAISFESEAQEQVSEEVLHDRWFSENDRCLALTGELEQETCWTNLGYDFLNYPKEYKSYKDERKKRAWEAGERNNWEDDPCKMNYYGEFSMNDLAALDPQESADLMECSATQLLEE
ncbi:MAG: hypothetical protein O3A13_03920 [Proteobacteria bacterium]|nr:hypothetical protein [Pseudomonadota bacterium]